MDTILSMARKYALRVGTPFCLQFLALGPNGAAKDILRLPKTSPYYATSSRHYFEDAQLAALFSKRHDIDAGVDPQQRCIESWFEAEQGCALTNRKLRRLDGRFGPLPLSDLALREFLSEVRITLSRWLGPAPTLESLEPKFGPGSTTCLSGAIGLPDKILSVPDATLELAYALEDIFPKTGWARWLMAQCHGLSPFRPSLLEPVECARFTTVKKKAEIDRPIEIQAGVNVAYQLALGRHMKHLFRRVGWDLTKAPDIHRRVSCEASITGILSTDDLKNASDTIAYQLVRLGFPEDWFELFDLLRHKRVNVNGKPVLLEKFSGMGNGFTFELETALFMAICHVSLERGGVQPKIGKNLFVFGDDIIVDSLCQNRVVRTLSLLGFTVNTEKSFGADVAFKESCGEDYFRGDWVRPYFPKKEPDEPHEWISFANGIRRVGINHYGADIWEFSPLYRLYLDAVGCIPISYRLWGPERFGDLVLHTDDTSKYETRLRDNRLYLRCVRFRPTKGGARNKGAYVEWDNHPPDARLASTLYVADLGGKPSFMEIGYITRNPVGDYKRGWVHFSTLGF